MSTLADALLAFGFVAARVLFWLGAAAFAVACLILALLCLPPVRAALDAAQRAEDRDRGEAEQG